MNSLTIPLEIQYLAIEQTSELNSVIEQKFARLNKVCNYITKCQVKIADLARSRQKNSNGFMISINLTMSEGFDIYTLRSPQDRPTDSIDRAISSVFAAVYRKLIELELEI